MLSHTYDEWVQHLLMEMGYSRAAARELRLTGPRIPSTVSKGPFRFRYFCGFS